METERERVRREEREARERREAELRQVAEAAARRSRLAQQEREARERREAMAQERDRLEQERREALKQATVERARIEAEASLRLVEAEQARKHELMLSSLREQHGAARYRLLAWLSSAALLLACAGAGAAYFGWISPAQARAVQHAESSARESAARAKAAELLLATEQSRGRALTAELQQARAALTEPQVPLVSAAKPVAPPPLRPPSRAAPARCRDTGDPLDDCLR